jgi:glycogen debranching enzyme
MPRALIRPDLVYAWKGPSLFIVDRHGRSDPDQPLTGFYFREARFLRAVRLTFDGKLPWLCEVGSPSHDALEFTYVYPEIAEYGGGGSGQSGDDVPRNKQGIPQRALVATVRYEVALAGLSVTARLENRAREAVDVRVEWSFDADFADIQEAQGNHRQQTSPVLREAFDGGIAFRYDSATLPYVTRVRLPETFQWEIRGGSAATRIRLGPQHRVALLIRAEPSDGREQITGSDAAERERVLALWRRSFTQLSARGNRVFERVLASNVADVSSFPLLEGRPDEWLAPQAGMPLYPALFGRDAIAAGWQTAIVDRGQLLDASLTRVGRMQSHRDNDWHDEEPGRLPYQMRAGPLALLNHNPYSAYYADYASPLMFVIALANLYAWTGDEDVLRRHWDTALRVLEWARERGDRDHDGYLEYQTRSSGGTKNQGWKDSGDAIVYDDGTPVNAPIATCELQSYWFAAQQLMGVLNWMRGRHADARAYFAAAADLKIRFNRDWWADDRGCFALAMDPEKRLVSAVTSNVGHCLAAGIVDTEHLSRVVGRLFAPDMFSGWGIRTLSSDHAFYDPLSYHRGTVWPVEQGTIVFGLRRYGFDARAHDLAGAMFDLAQLYPEYRIPECVGGFARGQRPTPAAYPQANTPQLWNASAFPLIVQSLLGLLPLAPYGVLIVDPALPEWLPDITLTGLRVGGATATLRFWRDADGSSRFDVVSTRGSLRVLRQPPLESVTATPWDRMTALAETLWRTSSFSSSRRRTS